eukprot:COSAG04_NODE_58_length_30339_cov_51.748578_20_plen_46_part_00
MAGSDPEHSTEQHQDRGSYWTGAHDVTRRSEERLLPEHSTERTAP